MSAMKLKSIRHAMKQNNTTHDEEKPTEMDLRNNR